MKKILLILFSLLIAISFIYSADNSFASASNININGEIGGDSKNGYLDSFNNGTSFISFSKYTDRGINDVLIMIAKDLKNFFYIIATIYFLIIVLRLLVSSNTEEEKDKFAKGIIWITIGIIVMQLAFSFTTILFDKGVGGSLAASLSDNLINPIIGIMETLASVFFIAIAVFAFYKSVTANGNEEEVKKSRMAIVYAIIGFVVIKFARILVESIYGKTNCGDPTQSCIGGADYSGAVNIIITIINWVNSFVSIVIILMIVYAGFNLIFSAGDEEKLKKVKGTLIYVAIGLVLLSINYIILTFFIFPNNQ